MKYSLNETKNDESIILKNDDCAFSVIIDCETKDGNLEAAMIDDEYVLDIETCYDEETTIDVESEYFYKESLCDAKTYEVKFDDNYMKNDSISCMKNILLTNCC